MALFVFYSQLQVPDDKVIVCNGQAIAPSCSASTSRRSTLIMPVAMPAFPTLGLRWIECTDILPMNCTLDTVVVVCFIFVTLIFPAFVLFIKQHARLNA
jgi:hypothetical protein